MTSASDEVDSVDGEDCGRVKLTVIVTGEVPVVTPEEPEDTVVGDSEELP